MNNDLTLVVMAAGMGSRFGGLKQIEPVGPHGEFILDYSIYDAIRAGFKKVVFVIKEENYEVFKNTIGKRIEEKIKVEYAFQKLDDLPEGYSVPDGRIKPWGTAHAIYAAREFINGDFSIINADDFYGKDAFLVLADFFKNKDSKSAKNQYAIVAYHVGNTMTENGAVKRGVCKSDEEGNLVSITECSIDKNEEGKIIANPLETDEYYEVDFETPVSMNLMGVDKSLVDYIKDDFIYFLEHMKNPLTSEYGLPAALLDTIRKDMSNVKLLKTSSKWYGMTYREDLEELKNGINSLIEKGDYKEDLWG